MTKVFLKQKRYHKNGFRLGRHVVKIGVPQEFDLDEKEMKELKGKGPQHWLKVVTEREMEAAPKSNQENKQMQDIKKKLVELGCELSGAESLEELEELEIEVEMRNGLKADLTERGIEFEASATSEELEFLLEEEE